MIIRCPAGHMVISRASKASVACGDRGRRWRCRSGRGAGSARRRDRQPGAVRPGSLSGHGVRTGLGDLNGGHPPSRAGVASGFLMTGHEIGAALGVAVLSSCMPAPCWSIPEPAEVVRERWCDWPSPAAGSPVRNPISSIACAIRRSPRRHAAQTATGRGLRGPRPAAAAHPHALLDSRPGPGDNRLLPDGSPRRAELGHGPGGHGQQGGVHDP